MAQKLTMGEKLKVLRKERGLTELEYSDKVVTALLSKKQSPALISKLIEHPDFTHLINAIDVYVR